MKKFQLGAFLESFRTDTTEAIKQVSNLGLDGFQMGANYGKYTPENMSKSDRKELLSLVKGYGLRFSALCSDFGHGFMEPKMNRELIERTLRIAEMALDLETTIITTHIGVIPIDPEHERYKIMLDACYTLAQSADRMGVVLAIETGPETAQVLKVFLDIISCKGIGVNMDPANLVMTIGDDPVKAVYTLKDYIVHTHAKDGRRLIETDIEILYGVIEGAIKDAVYFEELPLGQGDVDFNGYLNALADIGYNGFLTIEREVGENPADDIKLARDFLKLRMEQLCS